MRSGHPQLLGVDRIPLAEPDHEDGREPVGAQQGQLLEPRAGGVGATRGGHRLRQPVVLEQADGNQFGTALGQLRLLYLDLHRPRVYVALSVSSPAGPGGQGPGQ
jgi:hypothetical protein